MISDRQTEGLKLEIVIPSSVTSRARQAPPEGAAAQQKTKLMPTH